MRVGHAEHDRVARAHRHSVHGQRADLGDDRGGVVVASGARAGDHDHEVGPRGGGADGRGDLLGNVGGDLEAVRLASGRLGLGGEHHGVRVGQLALAELGAHRPDLVAGRDHRHDRPRGARRARSRPRLPPPPRPPAAAGGRPAAAARPRSRPRRSSGRAGTGAAAARSSTPPSTSWTSSRMTTASKSPGIGSPVSTTSKAPASSRTGRGLARADGVRGTHRDAVHRRRVEGRGRGPSPRRARPSRARPPHRAAAARSRAARGSRRPRTPPPRRRAPRRRGDRG